MSENQIFSINVPKSDKPRIVIVGGGFGGIHLLKKINHSDNQVVLIDRYNYHTFQPLLYQVATAGLEPDSVAGPLRKILKKNKEIYFRMLKVDGINTKKKLVKTTAGNLEYDYLVMATGAEINFFNNKNIAKNSFPLKQITHALDLRSHIFQQFEKIEILNKSERKKRQMTFVVVGAGPTGVEVCGALAELKKYVLPTDFPEQNIDNIQIYLVEGEDRVLPGMSQKSGEKARQYLEKMGVNVVLGNLIKDYDGTTAILSDDSKIETETMIWAAGVKGNLVDGFGKDSLEKGKLVVNEYNQVVTGESGNAAFEDVFAIGDVAIMKSDQYSKGLPGLAQVAIQQGKCLASNFMRMRKGKGMKKFQYTNKGVLATIGRNKAIADLPGNIHMSGFFGWLLWMVVHLLFLVGFRNKAVVFANWIWSYFTFERGIRLIIRPSSKNHDKISREMVMEMNEASK